MGRVRAIETLRLGIAGVTLVHAPLRTYEGFLWYDVDGLKFPESFELAICDGPAIYGHSEPYQGRGASASSGLLQDRDVRIDEILLDDAEDDRTPALQRIGT